jgi:5-methylcytosine-specific restriction endonuclease McrA
MCLADDIVTEATVVDHVRPHRGAEALFFDAGNLQSLCKTHHDRDKSAMERGTFVQFGPDGWPIGD